MFRTLIILTILFLTSAALTAQQPQPSPESRVAVRKQISGGVLNGKATSLSKPIFPPAARAAGASGAVTVQVLVDEKGDVISATAVSGHPLLRAAAEEAAKGAKFSPTMLDGQPVRVSGVITYNFVGSLSPAGLGFEVTLAERTGTFRGYTSPTSLASQLPADWTEEKAILNSLTYQDDVVKATSEPPPLKVEQKPDNNQRYTIKSVTTFSTAGVGSGRKLDAKSVAAVGSLRSMFERRLSVNDRTAWNYELGTALGGLLAEYDNASARQSNLAKLESLVAIQPADVSRSNFQSLKGFLESMKTATSDEDLFELKAKIEQLANLRY